MGLADPLPEYFYDWQLARWMGVTKDALDDMPVHEVMEARIVMGAINDAETARQQPGAKKGRRR